MTASDTRLVGRALTSAIGLLVVVGALRADPAEGKRYAVLVGVKHYEHSKLDPLEYTENDVTELADLLRPVGYEVVLLTDTTGSKDPALLPTRENIEKQLKAVLDRCRRNDLVLVAFAGHGVQFEKDPDCYFCPRDAKPLKEATDTLISLDDVYKRLDRCGAGVKLLLADSCRTDPEAGRGRDVADDVLERVPPRGVFAFFSCSAGERAYEHRDLKHGVFFHYVLRGLKEDVKDTDEEVTFEALALYVRKQVPRRVPQLVAGAKQTPSLRVRDASGTSPVLLSRRDRSLEADVEAITQSLQRGRSSTEYVQSVAKERIEQWRAAAERGSAAGQFFLARAFDLGAGVAEDPRAAAAWYRKAAEQNYALAQNNLAVFYELGRGIEKDQRLAVEWCRKAAEQGCATAQRNLGIHYRDGKGVEKDEREAVKWFRKAAEQNHPPSENSLGWCYLTGQGVDKDEHEAVKWFRKAAEQEAQAQNYLGLCYRDGRGVEKDDREAVKWFRKAAEQGLALAQVNLGWCYFNGRGVDRDLSEAVQWYRKAADQKNSYGQNSLGVCYRDGKGVDRDESQAFQWFRKAAEQGYAQAQNEVGICYSIGRGVEKDERQAVTWFRKAAEQNEPYAQNNLGRRYLYGQGVDRDEREAITWFRKAANQGLALAQNDLGVGYSLGRGVEKDERQAFSWCRKAAEQNESFAMNNLGHFYFNGQGVDRDEREAVNWYRKAAEKGNSLAQNTLAWCYENGRGVDKDEREAVKWYRKAAEQGYDLAQFNLGVCYEDGRGLDSDKDQAVQWYRKAAAQGHEKAKKGLQRLGVRYSPPEGPVAARRYALLVGVNDYEHALLPSLRCAVADVTQLRDVLARAGYEVVLLTADEARAREDRTLMPTTANVHTHLKALTKRFAKGDTLLIGLAGHGLQFAGDEDGYFCTQDARPFKEQAGTMVSVKWIYERLHHDAADGVKLLLVDACRNTPKVKQRGLDKDSLPAPPQGVGLLLSCAAGQVAGEGEQWGGGHGVFFHYVLEGLKGKARDEEGAVTWDSLRSYVKKQVARDLKEQTPEEAGRLTGVPVLIGPRSR
jgi:TPR repeat protein/uncharacterized caspase-like protein